MSKNRYQKEIPAGLEEPQPHVRRDLQDIPPPPCEKYRCAMYEHCKQTREACQAFVFYVETGRSPHPFTVWIRGKAHMMKKPYPSRAQFQRFPDPQGRLAI